MHFTEKQIANITKQQEKLKKTMLSFLLKFVKKNKLSESLVYNIKFKSSGQDIKELYLKADCVSIHYKEGYVGRSKYADLSLSTLYDIIENIKA